MPRSAKGHSRLTRILPRHDVNSPNSIFPSGHRFGARPLALAAAIAALALFALRIRPRMLNWGATRDETTSAYSGDEIVPGPNGGATMATTLPAPPERVWPWLVQMGGGRGGWYSWDWVDNNREPSANRIVPEWQDLKEGQNLKGPTNWWNVVVVDPNRSLVLRSSYGLTGRSFDPGTGPVPWAYVDGIWGFHLRPAPGGRTRLVIRTRSRSRPRLVMRPLGLAVFELVHFLMQTRQFHNLRARVGARCDEAMIGRAEATA